MDAKKLLEESSQYLMNTYNRFPIVLRKGRGMKVWSSDGKEYLDFVGGIAVNCLGHCHPKVVVAIQKQAQRLIHVSNYYHIEPQIKLAKLLVENSFADKAFFCNSGAEANEAAIKLARRYFREHVGVNRFEIITAINSFHGRTIATLSATGQAKFKAGFEPLVPGFKHVDFDDIDAVDRAITKETCAVLMEPIQGEGGVKIPDPDYLRDLREVCDRHGILLILDEVQTGMGRTGKLFAYEHFGIKPDIVTLAKGLGGGVPIGAMLATDKVASGFQPGTHASTFGGNPLVCAAAVVTLEVLIEDGFILDQCRRMGKYFKKRLEEMKKEFPSVIADVRGMGLLIGMELIRDGAPIVKTCMDRGLLINCTAGNILRFMPPLIVTEKEIDHLIDVLEQTLDHI
ncbi:Acetylornithine aminotransferase [Candidatus Sulfobium mesophilum]|uniref:Acetylornithine aminotransferase n=1 Tax=Candidatus Sulfobium mesophilum TaxID=2016548 RepID=A0A2U3QG71_9BACT|nr:Acetylornithine aminotransferase [Candidatus Sulfobium mesophilum]